MSKKNRLQMERSWLSLSQAEKQKKILRAEIRGKVLCMNCGLVMKFTGKQTNTIGKQTLPYLMDIYQCHKCSEVAYIGAERDNK